jgi:hypothetical protein
VANAAVWWTGIARWPSPADVGLWWGGMLCGSALALVGAALARRQLALAGAGLCAGAAVGAALLHPLGLVGGGVYTASLGSWWVDVDAAALPVVLLLLAATCVRPVQVGARTAAARLAWSVLPPLAGFVAVRMNPALPSRVESWLLTAIAGAALAAFVIGAARARRDPAGAVAGALALAVIAPEAVWLGLGVAGIASDSGAVNFVMLLAAGALTAALVLAPIRRAARPAR